jgi:aryl-alcohol dehydrogenase-like predicted oxidoreductase
MEQPLYNLLDRERVEVEYLPLFDRYGLGTTTWSPLASGALTGKYLAGIPAASRATLPGYEWLREKMVESDRGQARMKRVAGLPPIARELGITPSQLAIAWCLLNPNVSTVILGASRLEQLEENLRAAEALPLLTGEVRDRLSAI